MAPAIQSIIKAAAAALLSSTTLSFGPAMAAPPTGYKLVWHDEFSTDGLPSARNWVYDTEANKTGWYNNELQYYAARRLANTRVKDGKLHIIARKERLTSAADYGQQDYTSGRLITRGKASWTYGFVEVRAKLPCTQGAWPAIWMLGTADKWPDSGEIDIMEKINKDPTIYGTLHTRSTAGTSGNGGAIKVATACTAYHRYQMTWTPAKISIGVDDKIYHSYRNAGSGSAQWPFSKPQYLLLNLAVGGDWPGAPDATSKFPMEMLVDYVRIYRK
ncbi:glycoside hydrolase family 16 protein [Oryzibacter oryziterrae]|uniref:glycoside hydrolase family 16 protein n=1 Tax=Oryzibacter oryziterrae TaxID=2766474 RepID=UPI001F208055|nr:glycoside hydrolase family 16 protein [Oryzibacter oryziterrae]